VLAREIELYPDAIDACNALGVALIRQSRREDALAAFMEAARRDPGSVSANNNVANVLSELGREAEALPYLERAVAAAPDLAEAHHNLGTLLQTLKRHEEAIVSLDAALRLAPRMSYTLSYLVWNQLAICRWEGLGARIEELRVRLRDEGVPAEPFVFVALPTSPAEQRACAERHVQVKLPARRMDPPAAPRSVRARIRVAYLSADFSEHATSQLAARLFELHDRAQLEVLGISYGPHDVSPMRARLVKAFDRFVDVRSKGDAEAAALLRELEVDIAVDLKGYTTGARPGILAARPAPVQVSYLGFPGTLGAPFIDYLIADRFVVPEEDRAHYSENVVYLPDCYQVNDATRAIAARTPSRAEAGLPEGRFVFCCFNNNFKITPEVFGIWMRLLRELDGSVLWLLEDSPAARRNLERAAGASGIDASRLVFAHRVAHADHLARHRLADLFIDTLPYNAHTTASDALWGGLPVLTCAGASFAGRVAGSVLRAAGLPELVARDLHEYEALALALARDAARLGALRERLARNRMQAPLFDSDRFRRHLEAAYAAMWAIWMRGEQPRGFSV
jgi:predicted O-linked N-acetylglucosamine transferase (SPINDLY family)